MKDETALGAGGEFDRIRQMIRALGTSGQSIGDDASVVDVPAGHKLVVSTDTSVDGVHFEREWLTLEEIGYRATAAALSDIAAMGAGPLGVLLAIALPDSDSESLASIARGAGAAAADSGTVVIGGDLSSSPTLTVTASVLGSALRPLLRSSARPGDRIYVTGNLGGSALALAAFQLGETPRPGIREKFVKPRPRIKEAAWLAGQGINACIDMSDGIVGDLGHIAAASGVNLLVDVQKIPLFESATTDIALSSGEEYELCVTSPHEIDVEQFSENFGVPLSLIGFAEASASPVVIFQLSGKPIEPPQSFSHFSE